MTDRALEPLYFTYRYAYLCGQVDPELEALPCPAVCQQTVVGQLPVHESSASGQPLHAAREQLPCPANRIRVREGRLAYRRRYTWI